MFGEQFARRARQRITMVLVALFCMLGLAMATSTAAQASAYGCTGYGSGVTFQGVYVKNGTWCGGINGGGTYVNYISGNFYNHIPGNSVVCNFAMRADFYDASGHWYAWASTGTSYRCSNASDLPNIGIYSSMRAGSVRISLLSNGGTVAAVSESIHP